MNELKIMFGKKGYADYTITIRREWIKHIDILDNDLIEVTYNSGVNPYDAKVTITNPEAAKMILDWVR